MCKKTLCLVLACVMILSCLSVVSAAPDIFTLNFNDQAIKPGVVPSSNTGGQKHEYVQKSANPVDNYYKITTLDKRSITTASTV